LVDVGEGEELAPAEDEDVVAPGLLVVPPLGPLVRVVPPLPLVAGVEEAPAAVDVTSLEPELVADAPEAVADTLIERVLFPVGAEVAERVVLPVTHN